MRFKLTRQYNLNLKLFSKNYLSGILFRFSTKYNPKSAYPKFIKIYLIESKKRNSTGILFL